MLPEKNRTRMCFPETVLSVPKVAESAISALVQMNFLVSHFAGVTVITDRNLDKCDPANHGCLHPCLLLQYRLSFAGKDKKDGSVLGLPGKVDWSPTMVSLVLVRALETASRMVAFNIVQVSLRGGWCGHLGVPWPCCSSWQLPRSASQRQKFRMSLCLGSRCLIFIWPIGPLLGQQQ